MDFELTAEQSAALEMIQDFVRRSLNESVIRKYENDEEYPRALLDQMAELGVFGIGVPAEYGGAGGSLLDLALVSEQLSYGWAVLGLVLGRVAYFGHLLGVIGNEWQRHELLPKLAEGKLHMYVSLTEENAGSDLAALQASAVREGDEYVINGYKPFSTGSHVADYVMVAVRTDSNSTGGTGISLILVDPKSDGVSITPWKMLGQHALKTCAVRYENVRVPSRNLVGSEGEGWSSLRLTLAAERTMQAASCVGAAQQALDVAADYARTREQFKRPIGKFQAISHMLADVKIQIQAARLLAYRAASLGYTAGDQAAASMAKVAASEAWTRAATDGLQVLGGLGYTTETPMERHYRDSKLYEIGGGTSQVQRTLIARSLGL